MKKIYGFTFGDIGQFSDFRKTKFRLQKEAIDTGWFNDFFCFDRTDIEQFPNDKRCPGIGYWFWKPALALKILNEIEKDSILFFLDAGNSIINNEKSKERFFQYAELCDSGPGIVIFRGEGPKEIQYSKRDTLILLGCDSDEYLQTPQLWCGLWIIKNNQFAKDLMQEWYNVCSIHHAVNWENSYNPEHPEFVTHRYEQSVLSLLCKKQNQITNNYIIHSQEINSDFSDRDWYNDYPIKCLRLSDSRLGDPNF
jgi:hypothetical protein